eukprot:GHRQ01009733.1.p1 GENE.GHRQ01009733.1~~GHRQ01009733.1.p1  ORF type:complete len:724 (-),score=88.22 GHRQ01009733.1:166-2166(-)
MQCLCHAWHALLGRKVAPNYFYAALQSNNAPKSELAAFGRSGPYHSGGLNLYAVEHNTNNRKVTLANFLTCTTQRYSKQHILEKAPAHCKGIIACFALPSSEQHYTAWRQAADGHWYNCDSIPYGQTGKVKRMRNQEWEDFTGTLFCLVDLDPLAYGYALFDVPRRPGRRRRAQAVPATKDLVWADGTTLEYSSRKQRIVNPDGTITPDAARVRQATGAQPRTHIATGRGAQMKRAAGHTLTLGPHRKRHKQSAPAKQTVKPPEHHTTQTTFCTNEPTTGLPPSPPNDPQQHAKPTTRNPAASTQHTVEEYFTFCARATNITTSKPATKPTNRRPSSRKHVRKAPNTQSIQQLMQNAMAAKAAKTAAPTTREAATPDTQVQQDTHHTTAQNPTHPPASENINKESGSGTTSQHYDPPKAAPASSTLLTAQQQHLMLYLQNVQGISNVHGSTHRATSKRAELKQLITQAGEQKPHLVVLTDHKYTKKHDTLKTLLSGYQVFLNPLPTSRTGDPTEPRFGVVVAVTQPLCELGTVQSVPLHDNTLGQYVTHVLIDLPTSTPLHILGVYSPPNGNAKPLRERIYKECTMVLTLAKENKHTVILAGDWNGTAQDNDRASGKTYARDLRLRQFLTNMQLQHTDPPPPDRPETGQAGHTHTCAVQRLRKAAA